MAVKGANIQMRSHDKKMVFHWSFPILATSSSRIYWKSKPKQSERREDLYLSCLKQENITFKVILA